MRDCVRGVRDREKITQILGGGKESIGVDGEESTSKLKGDVS